MLALMALLYTSCSPHISHVRGARTAPSCLLVMLLTRSLDVANIEVYSVSTRLLLRPFNSTAGQDASIFHSEALGGGAVAESAQVNLNQLSDHKLFLVGLSY